jgi:hypothetical protein
LNLTTFPNFSLNLQALKAFCDGEGKMQSLAYTTLEATLPPNTIELAPAAASREVQAVPHLGNLALVATAGLHVYPLKEGFNAIGRHPSCPIRLTEAAVSRNHANILVSGHGLILIDQGSTNGTFVNSSRVTLPTILSGGDRIRIGSLEFVVAA